MIPRGVLESDIFKYKHTLSEDMAYIYFFYKAAFADHIVEWNGYSLNVKRGQLATSYRNLMNELKWSHVHIREFLEKLENHGKITVTKPIGFIVITLHDYIEAKDDKDYSTGSGRVNYPDHFIKFFENYKSRKVSTGEGSKKEAFKEYQKIIKNKEATAEEIFNASEVHLNYCNKIKSNGQKTWTNAANRWLKGASFDEPVVDSDTELDELLSNFQNTVNK